MMSESTAVLLACLRDIDPSARLDQNGPESLVYEVRIYGRHVGFMEFGEDGRLHQWVA